MEESLKILATAVAEDGVSLVWAWLGLQAVALIVAIIWGWHIFMPRKR